MRKCYFNAWHFALCFGVFVVWSLRTHTQLCRAKKRIEKQRTIWNIFDCNIRFKYTSLHFLPFTASIPMEKYLQHDQVVTQTNYYHTFPLSSYWQCSKYSNNNNINKLWKSHRNLIKWAVTKYKEKKNVISVCVKKFVKRSINTKCIVRYTNIRYTRSYRDRRKLNTYKMVFVGCTSTPAKSQVLLTQSYSQI